MLQVIPLRSVGVLSIEIQPGQIAWYVRTSATTCIAADARSQSMASYSWKSEAIAEQVPAHLRIVVTDLISHRLDDIAILHQAPGLSVTVDLAGALSDHQHHVGSAA
jgi:hypothetical protein